MCVELHFTDQSIIRSKLLSIYFPSEIQAGLHWSRAKLGYRILLWSPLCVIHLSASYLILEFYLWVYFGLSVIKSLLSKNRKQSQFQKITQSIVLIGQRYLLGYILGPVFCLIDNNYLPIAISSELVLIDIVRELTGP